MSQLSRVLRGSLEEPGMWCPGCEEMHVLPWKRGKWTFDGNVESPTFVPSFRIKWTGKDDDGREIKLVCHFILTAGVLDFCGDSTHVLKGQKVPLPPLPPHLCD